MYSTKPPLKKTKTSSRKIIYAVLGVLVIAALIGGGLMFKNRRDNRNVIITADGQEVKLEPATEEEQAESESAKDNAVKRDDIENTPPPTPGAEKKAAEIVINNASASGISAYVANVFEEGGSCTAEATKDGQTVTASSEGFQNVSYTQCAPLDWPAPLGAGQWNIKVTYASASSQGSKSQTLTVN